MSGKIKYLSVNTEVLKNIGIPGLILCISIGISVGISSYSTQKQISESSIDSNDLYVNEDGECCKDFEVGEHVIKITNIDYYKRNIESIDGYEIENVNLKPYLYWNCVTYVNDEPVSAVGTYNKEGNIEFNDFGTPVKELKKTK